MYKYFFLFQISIFQNHVAELKNFRSCINSRNFTSLIMSFTSEQGSCGLIRDFKQFKYSPSKLLELSIEENDENFVRRNIKGAVFSRVVPSPIDSPKLVSFSKNALEKILNLHICVTENKDFVNFISGNYVLDGSTPLAHRYGGHQFGYWAMQLGDGRAILLGEIVNCNGERWELQLKGSGKTPYSRDGDGRAVLRSSIREFLCSEAMYNLGIPTSRAASIVIGQNKVIRDLLYDGHPILENVAVVLRLAPSWFRIGSLELLAKNKELHVLKSLIDFILKEHFFDLYDHENRIAELFRKVSRMTSDLVVFWQSVGFTHGVLNTDNISLLGITIDYGPFGFMENCDFYYVPNHSDSEARYCYGNQPRVILYNLVKLSEALAPIANEEEIKEMRTILQNEVDYINSAMSKRFSQKLGFEDSEPELVEEINSLMAETKSDFTMTYRELSETPLDSLLRPDSTMWALSHLSTSPKYQDFVKHYQERFEALSITDEERMKRMMQINPRYILRNWMAQEAIKKAESGDYSEVNLLLKILETPYTRHDEAEVMGYASKPPSWSKNLTLSCSS